MKYFNGTAQRIGWLFVLATVAGVLSVVVMSSTLGDEDLLSAAHANQGSLIVGNMLIFVMLVAMVGTAVLLSPILRIHSETLALSYVLARTLEVVVIAMGLVAVLLLVPPQLELRRGRWGRYGWCRGAGGVAQGRPVTGRAIWGPR